MAYTATVTKQSVSKVSNLIFNVTINVVVNDGVSDVFESAASENYNTNEADMNGIKARLLKQFKDKWDKYAEEHNIFSAAAFDTIVGQIQSTANTYINS